MQSCGGSSSRSPSSLSPRKSTSQPTRPYAMPAKRKAEGAAAEDSESPDVDALPMTADMADELRENLIEKQKRAAIHQQEGRKKKRRIHNHPRMDPIDFDPTHFTPGAAPFFKLPRELRDEIYHWVWMDAPQIQQQYEKKYYMVTYGEIDVMKRTEPSDRKVRLVCGRILSACLS
jgi:hypothetical protein